MRTIAESEGSNNDADLLTFLMKSSGDCPSQDDWHASLKIGDAIVNFKLDLEADCNVTSQ